MKLASLFDGSGGFPLAGAIHGIVPVWASEIEPYPIAVTTSRFPNMKHLGDVCGIDGGQMEAVDVITFGSPCQDLSTAGKQEGIHEGKRSSLFFQAIRIIQEMRAATNGKYPRFAIWENVPGAFSSHKGEDFRAVLQAFTEAAGGAEDTIPMPEKGKWSKAGVIVGDGWSLAWRTYDAQFWGVPQRRKRIYLVADFGSERAGQILFEREGVRRDHQPGEETGKRTSGHAGGSPDGNHIAFAWNNSGKAGLSDSETTAPTVKATRCGEGAVVYEAAAFMGGQGAKARGIAWCDDGTAPTIKAAESGTNSIHDVVYAIDCQNLIVNEGISSTLQSKGQTLTHQNPILYRQGNFGKFTDDGTASTLKERDHKSANDLIVEAMDGRGNRSGQITPTITGDHENRITDYTTLILEKKPRKYIVRRLTPLECGRLQGFPDGWAAPDRLEEMTDERAAFWERVRREYFQTVKGKAVKPYRKRAALIAWRNKLYSESAEYKMWGNGIAFPCAADVLEKVAAALREGEAA